MTAECTRCLLNTDIPGIKLAPDGECSVCKRHDQVWGDWSRVKEQRRVELEELLAAAKAAHRQYDALVPISGGKDSVYVLYLARKRYHLNCLAVTFDNGFLSDHARGNIDRAVDALETDHIYFKMNWPTLRKLYRLFFLKTGFFCPVCMQGIGYAVQTAINAHRVPIVLGGTSHRTEEYIASEFMVPGSHDFHRAVLEGEPLAAGSPLRFGDTRLRGLLGRFCSLKTIVRYHYGVRINLPVYVEWDYDELFRTITQELGWRSHKAEAEHTDCRVDPVVDYIRWRKYPALVPELTRYSKLVTLGKMTKDEARAKLDAGAAGVEPEALPLLLEALDITREQFEQVLSDRSRHLPYVARHYGRRAWMKRAVSRLTGRGASA
jgi:hypothetical protein